MEGALDADLPSCCQAAKSKVTHSLVESTGLLVRYMTSLVLRLLG